MHHIKTIRGVILAALSFVVATIQAATAPTQIYTVQLDWDHPGTNITEYRAYQLDPVVPDKWTLVSTVKAIGATPPAKTTSVSVPTPGVHTFRLTAVDATWGESPPSVNGSTSAPGAAPTNIRVKVIVTVTAGVP